MSTPRQYTEGTDPNAYPADQSGQQTEYAGATDYPADPSQGQATSRAGDVDPAFSHPDAGMQEQHGRSEQFGTQEQYGNQEQFSPAPGQSAQPSSGTGLFAENHLSELRARWNDVQASFVDDPRECVQKADHLVSSAVEQLTANFAQTRSRLEEQWQRGQEASTEDLRVALKSYRDFFDRLLAV